MRPPSRELKCWSPGPALSRVDGGAGGCKDAFAIHQQHVLPLLRLSSFRGHAVGRLQCVPFDPATGGALAAPRAGPGGRPYRADAGNIGRPARSPANDHQCSGPGAFGRRADCHRTRACPGCRPGRTEAACMRMLSAARGAFRGRHRHQRPGSAVSPRTPSFSVSPAWNGTTCPSNIFGNVALRRVPASRSPHSAEGHKSAAR